MINIICKLNKQIIVVSKKNLKRVWLNFNNVKTIECEKLKIIQDNHIESRSQIFLWFLNCFVWQIRCQIILFNDLLFANEWRFWKNNQFMKIALRYYLTNFKNFKNWFTIIDFIQEMFNNFLFSIDKTAFVTILRLAKVQTWSILTYLLLTLQFRQKCQQNKRFRTV